MEYQLAIKVTSQIRLVQPELYLAEALYDKIKSNYQYLAIFLDFIQEDMTVEDERQYLSMMLEHQAQNKGRLYLIYYADELIGTIDLHNIKMQHKKAEIGYWIDESYSGRQITTQCVNHLCYLAFEKFGLNKLTIKADTRNLPSNKVAEKTGFSFVGTELEDMFDGESYRDMNYYSLLKRDYNKK
ncbi:N-acetyltransferase [Staphylococcus gallinarum]|uniref:N-acetyltransferase n=1 Tax=Staphylococcus gallinarum TaxID=1293 RepID=A0A3A0VS27_STAGA|nr:GNAT family protein [Staphylococcus gallinarum]RIP37200.1 N-acetyltransferase [Staphylococcus gallinarum]